MTAPTSNIAAQILAHLSSKSLTPTQAWLTSFLASQRPTTPLPALKQTALFRILASDIGTTIQHTPSSVFPSDILDASIQERRLAGPIPVQILDIEDIGHSRWSQIEAIEAAERGETTKGREIIRVVPTDDGVSESNAGTTSAGGGPLKLLLQDVRGVQVYAFELMSVPGLNSKMNIGTKLLLKEAVVARGVVMLEPGTTTVLGGKLEAAHKAWKEGRKAALRTAVGTE